MRSDFENDIWEAFLKDAVIEHSLRELEKYETDKIQQTPLPLGVSQSLCKPSN